jgi:choline kinase
MQVIILGAGRGSRLGSDALPKCLTPLAGRAWLDWQLDVWRAVGAEAITLVTGYAADTILAHAQITRRVHHARWGETGPVASLHFALVGARASAHSADPHGDEILVAYADCLWHPDWIRHLRTASAGIAISSDRDWLRLWEERFADPLSDAETFEVAELGGGDVGHKRLTGIGGRTPTIAHIQGQFMGLLRFCGTGVDALRGTLARLSDAERDALDMTALLTLLLREGQTIEVVAGRGGWVELDHRSDLALYELRSADPNWSHDWRRPPR